MYILKTPCGGVPPSRLWRATTWGWEASSARLVSTIPPVWPQQFRRLRGGVRGGWMDGFCWVNLEGEMSGGIFDLGGIRCGENVGWALGEISFFSIFDLKCQGRKIEFWSNWFRLWFRFTVFRYFHFILRYGTPTKCPGPNAETCRRHTMKIKMMCWGCYVCLFVGWCVHVCWFVAHDFANETK